MRRILWIDGSVSAARENLAGDQDQPGDGDAKRDQVHAWEPRAPRRDTDPDATDDNYRFGPQESEQTKAAVIRVRPEEQSDPDRGDEDEPRDHSDQGGALRGALLGPPFFLALEFLVRRRRLRRQAVEFALEFFELY